MEIIKSFIDSFINLYKSSPGLVISAFVVGILALLSDLYYPKFRGFMGEFWVKLELSKLPKDSYIVLNIFQPRIFSLFVFLYIYFAF